MSETNTIQARQLVLPVEGMSCASCAARIEKKVGELDGVEKASVNFGAASATVDFDPDRVSPESIIQAIENIGFNVPTVKKIFPVEGMTCASCVSRVEKKTPQSGRRHRRSSQPRQRTRHRRLSGIPRRHAGV